MIDRYATLRNGLVGAWCPSLRAGGYTLEDRSNVRYNGTLTGATWSAGALSLTAASSQYAAIWDSANVNKWIGGAMTVTAWIRPTRVSGGAMAIASALSSGGSAGEFQLEVARTANKVTWLQSGSSVDATSTATISANQWSFVGASRVYNGTNWDLRLIINNVIEASTTSTGPYANTTGTLSIGRGGAYNGLYFDGLIDDVRIWNRPLTNSEIGLLATGRGVGLIPRRHRRGKSLTQFYTRVGGVWKTATPYINVGGVWKQASPHINSSGTWK